MNGYYERWYSEHWYFDSDPLLAIEQCFDVKQMADVRFLTQGQAGSKLSQRYVEAPIAICNVSQH